MHRAPDHRRGNRPGMERTGSQERSAGMGADRNLSDGEHEHQLESDIPSGSVGVRWLDRISTDRARTARTGRTWGYAMTAARTTRQYRKRTGKSGNT